MSNKVNDSSFTKAEGKETSQLIKVPKNIRQIGQPSQSEKIYIEDYVVTYLRKYAETMPKEKNVIVLLGQGIKKDNCDYLFIDGALETGYDFCDEVFESKFWNNVNSNIDKYFSGSKVVGWGVICKEWNQDEDDVVRKHCSKYKDNDTFLVYDVLEREENFYFIRYNKLIKQKGYYVYYERNEKMQNYMLEYKGNKSIEYGYSEEVITKIRNVVGNRNISISDNNGKSNNGYWTNKNLSKTNSNEKKGNIFPDKDNLTKNKQESKEKKVSFKYATIMLMIIAILGISAGKIDKIEEITKEKAGVVVSKAEKIKTEQGSKTDDNSNTLDVETISGKIEKNTSEEDKINSKDNDINNKEKSVKSTDNPKETIKPSQKPTATPKPTAKASATPKATAKVTATPKPSNSTKKKTTETSSKSQIIYYTVVKGDSLESISKKMYGNTSGVSKLKAANNLDNEDVIIEGEKLIIPQ